MSSYPTDNALSLLRNELLSSLARTQRALGAYLEQPGDGSGLDTVDAGLAEVRGALLMLERPDAVALVDESRAVLGALGRGELHDPESARETLLKAVLQLPRYLDWLERGGRGRGIDLQPLVRELGAARERGAPAGSDTGPGGGDRPSLQALAARLRPGLQRALLALLRGRDVQQHVTGLAHIFAAFRDAATSEPVYRLWWLAEVLFQDLGQRPSPPGREASQVLRDLDHQVKVLAEADTGAVQGSTQALEQQIAELLGSSETGARVLAERQGYQPPAPRPTGPVAASASAPPEPETLTGIAEYVKESLDLVKDAVDRLMRGTSRRAGTLAEEADRLHRAANVLNLLNMDFPASLLRRQEGVVRKLIAEDGEISEDQLFDLASGLLLVEDSLGDVNALAFEEEVEGADREGGAEAHSLRQLQNLELGRARGAAAREAIKGIAGARELAANLDSAGSTPRWGEIATMLHNVTGAVALLSPDRAAAIVGRLEDATEALKEGSGGSRADRLACMNAYAETLVALEVFLQTLEGDHVEDMTLLDRAERSLDVLEAAAGIRPQAGAAVESEETGFDKPREPMPELEPPKAQIPSKGGAGRSIEMIEPAYHDEDDLEQALASLGTPEPDAREQASTPDEEPLELPELPDLVLPEEGPAPPSPEKMAEAPTGGVEASPDVDPEFLEIFQEEAEGELASIAGHLQRWRENPGDFDALAAIRRSFHTLKGSGRMVGLTAIGDGAWAVENLLNHVLDGSVQPSGAVADVVDQGHGVLAGLMAGRLGTEALPPLTGAAEALAGTGAQAPELPAIEETAEPAAGEAPEQAASPSLRQAEFKEVLGDLAMHPAWREPEEPVVEEPVAEEPVAEEPVAEEPVAEEPVAEEPVAEEPVAEEPVAEEPVAEEPVAEEPVAEEPVAEEPVAEEPVAEEPVAEEPVAEEPVAEEPVAEEPVAEEPVAEEPVAGELRPAAMGDADQQLVEVFLLEAAEILDNTDLILQRLDSEPRNVELLNDLRREMHTLKGSSRMAGFMAIGDLAHAMESLLDSVAGGPVTASAALFDALQQALDRLNAMVSAIQHGAALLPADDLIRDLHALLEGAAGAAGPTRAEQEQAATEVDRESFLLRAAEILDNADLILQQWSGDPAATAVLASLRRDMHTLKGSSRMIGLETIGDLAHAAENLLDAMNEPAPPPSPPALDALQRVMDRLNGMLSQLHASGEITPAQDLVDELHALLQQRGPGGAPAPATRVVPVPSADVPAAAPGVGTGTVRVSARLLDSLVNQMGESSIFRARVDQGVGVVSFNLAEMDQTVNRLRQQLRRLEIETEAQILFRYEESGKRGDEEFDPLELDRFSELQQLSRSLVESVDDLFSIKNLLEDTSQEMAFLLDQQAKVDKEIQEGLMRSRLVRFDTVMPRLRRVVRQAAQELGKQAELVLKGAESEVERSVLERMVAPIEHVLRNCVAHGVETPQIRRQAGKRAMGTVTVSLEREGSELVLTIADDGAGLNFEAIRAKGEAAGLLAPGEEATEEELAALLLRPGFSTASQVTQVAGRGVGMDVFADAVTGLRGALQIRSRAGEGTRFIARLPFSLAVTQALLVEAGGETFAVPLLGVDAVARLEPGELESYLAGGAVLHEYAGRRYPLHGLGVVFGGSLPLTDGPARLPVLLFHSAEASAALQVDAVLGSQEIIVKPVGPQVFSTPGISGATVLGDGRVVLILEPAAVVRHLQTKAQQQSEARVLRIARQEVQEAPLNVLVIDDSITMRKVTARFLERHGVDVSLAKDGVDAVALLQERVPDVAILDIEMPRMDGFELVGHIRNQPALKHLPVIMVTSRSGEKHRERAAKLGVNDYLTKPYQETELLGSIRKALGERARLLREPD